MLNYILYSLGNFLQNNSFLIQIKINILTSINRTPVLPKNLIKNRGH